MKNLRKSKGITLIALVITIIVLLILAGVAISMLSGENGILRQAAHAKQETEKKEIDETVRLAVLSALTAGKGEIKGEYAFETLNNELKKAGYTGNDLTESDLPATITIGDESFKINQNGSVSEPSSIEKLKQTEEPVTGANAVLEDQNGDKITIPVNFNIAKESPTLVTEGMIIEDSQDNQYVWIPVFEKTENRDWGADYSEVKSETDYTNIQKALKDYTQNYAKSNYTDTWYGNEKGGQYTYTDSEGNTKYYTNGNMTEDEYNTLYHSMLTSVYKNKGFYIGRYEMGVARVEDVATAKTVKREGSSREYKASNDNTTNEAPKITEVAPVSKANAVGYNYITQSQAQMLAKKLGEGSDYSKVTSSIMFGVQWDAVCVFIENFDTKNTATTKKEWLTKKDYGILWGNYRNSEYTLDRGFYYSVSAGNKYLEKVTTPKPKDTTWVYTTGAVDQNSSLNIYDFAGNFSEWTLEKYDSITNPCVYRGNDFLQSEFAAFRYCYGTYYNVYNFSSRVSLYIE